MLLVPQPVFNRPAWDFTLLPSFGGSQCNNDYFAEPVQTIFAIPFLIPKLLTVDSQDSLCCDAVCFAYSQTFECLDWNCRRFVNIPGELCLGIDFVHVLTARSGTPRILKLDLAHRNGDLVGDAEL